MFDKFNDMHFMDILRKCDIPVVINQKQHFVPVFLFYVSMCSMWAPSRWQHNHTRSRKLAPTLSTVSADTLPTYQLFDAKSQLLPNSGPTSVNLDILNSWLRCHVDVCGVSQTDSRTSSILSPAPVTTGDRPDLTWLFPCTVPSFSKWCTIREMASLYGVSEALQPYSRRKLRFTETNDLVSYQNCTIFIFSSAEKTIADSDLIFDT